MFGRNDKSQREPIYGKDYIVDIFGVDILKYKEGNHRMTIEEMDFREPVVEFSRVMIKQWDPPYQNEEIGLEKKEQIFLNIYKYLTEVKKFKKIVIVD